MMTQYLERCITYRKNRGGEVGRIDAERAEAELQILLEGGETDGKAKPTTRRTARNGNKEEGNQEDSD